MRGSEKSVHRLGMPDNEFAWSADKLREVGSNYMLDKLDPPHVRRGL